MPRAKKQSTDLVQPWKQQLAEFAKQGKVGTERTSDIDKISTKGSRFRMDGKVYGDDKGRGFSAIVINSCVERSYYDSDYDDNTVNVPACFALSYTGTDMEPHKDSSDKKAGSCSECDLGKWDGDTPPSCKERRRLAVVVQDENDNPVVKLLSITSTSVSNWKKYVKELNSNNLEPIQAGTYIHFDEESTKAYQPICFDFVSELTNQKQLEQLVGFLPHAQKLLDQGYDPSLYSKPSGNTAAKAGKKKTAKKKTSARRSKFSK